MPISDFFYSHVRGLTSTATGGFDITPNDGADLPTVTTATDIKGLY